MKQKLMNRTLLVGLLLVALAGPLFADQKVTVCIPQWEEELLTATILLAKDRGFFQEQGLDVNIVVVRDAKGMRADSQVLHQLSSNNANFAAATLDAMLLDGIDSRNIQPLYFYLYGSTYDTNLVVGKNSGIKTVADLKGKKVRLGQPPTYIAMENILKEAGLTMNDIQIVRGVASNNVLEQLDRGTVDAAITYLPTMPLMVASGKVAVLKKNIFDQYVMSYVPHSFVAVNPKFAAANPAVVSKFSKALLKADAVARANPTELLYTMSNNAKLLGMPNYNFDKVLAEKSRDLFGEFKLTRLSDKLTSDGKTLSVMDTIERFQSLLLQHKFISKKMDLAAWKKFVNINFASK